MKTLLKIILAVAIAHSSVAQTYVSLAKPAGEKEWGYVNLKGEFIIAPQFRKCSNFSKVGLAPFYDTKEKTYRFINLKGEVLETEVKDFKLINAFGFGMKGFEDGLARVEVNDLWGYLDAAGKLAIDAKYDHVNEFNSGFATAQLGEKYVVLNKQGQEIAIEVPGIIDVKGFSEGLAPYRTESKFFGYIGVDGKVAIPAKFSSVGYFSDGVAWAKTESGAVGYIDKSGEWVIEPQFSAAKDFEAESGVARIKKDAQWGYVNKSGEIIYVDTELWGDFSQGLCKGRKGDLFGFYNAKGEWVIQPQFENVRDFKNGYAAAEKNKMWGIIDKTGSWIIEPTFDGIKDVELVN